MLALGIGIGIPFFQAGNGAPPPNNEPPALDFSSLTTAIGQGTDSQYLPVI